MTLQEKCKVAYLVVGGQKVEEGVEEVDKVG